MSKTTNIIENTVHVAGSGLSNELLYVSLAASTVIMEGAPTLSVQPDFTDTTTTTANYTVGDVILDSDTNLLYDCILNSTSGELLTNPTYFTLNTTNTLSINNGLFNVTDGIGNNGYNVRAFRFTGTIDFATCPDGINYVALDELGNPLFLQERPVVVKDAPTGATTEYQFATSTGLLYDKTGTALTAPISFLRKPYQVANGTPMVEIGGVEPLPLFITDSIEVEGEMYTKGLKVSEGLFGVGQTLENLTGSRFKQVTYTNNSGRTKFLILSGTSNTTQQLYIDNELVANFTGDSAAGGVFVPIINGSEYRVEPLAGTIAQWYELG